jgi:hypothetical protein
MPSLTFGSVLLDAKKASSPPFNKVKTWKTVQKRLLSSFIWVTQISNSVFMPSYLPNAEFTGWCEAQRNTSQVQKNVSHLYHCK